MANVTKNINDSVAGAFSGKTMQYRFDEIMSMKPEDLKEETRTAEEIIQHIKDGLDEIGA